MSQEEQSEWPTFESVFGEIAPGTPTARERAAELEAKRAAEKAAAALAEVQAKLDAEKAAAAKAAQTAPAEATFDDPDLQAALEPLPDVVEPVLYDDVVDDDESYGDDIVDLDNPAPGDIVGDLDKPFSTGNAFEEDSVDIETTLAAEPVIDSLDEDGWVTHTIQDIEVTEPEITSTERLTPIVHPAPAAPPESAPLMDLSGLIDPLEPPLDPIPLPEPELIDQEIEVETDLGVPFFEGQMEDVDESDPADLLMNVENFEPDRSQIEDDADEFGASGPREATLPEPTPESSPAPVPEPDAAPQPTWDEINQAVAPLQAPATPTGNPDDPWGQLRPKNEPEKITFWENRPKFFGGDERRKARARRERQAALSQQQALQAQHPPNAPESLQCPQCGHVSQVDIVDPISGQLHIRCDLCGHVWSESGR